MDDALKDDALVELSSPSIRKQSIFKRYFKTLFICLSLILFSSLVRLSSLVGLSSLYYDVSDVSRIESATYYGLPYYYYTST